MADSRTANPEVPLASPSFFLERAQNPELPARLRPRCQAMRYAWEKLTWEGKAQSLSRVLASAVRHEVKRVCRCWYRERREFLAGVSVLMAREWKPRAFDALYERFVCRDEMEFGGRAYYFRYRSRY